MMIGRIRFLSMVVFTLVLTSACIKTYASSELTAFTSTRSTISIQLAPDGTVWVCTRGGVLHRNPDGKWQKFTVADGLPTNEVSRITFDGDRVTAWTPIGTARYESGKWENINGYQESPSQGQRVRLRDEEWSMDPTGLSRISEDSIGTAQFPDSTGTHISAMCLYRDVILVSLFGDGLWQFDSKGWYKGPAVPDNARDITALACSKESIWIGTRRDGIWEYDGKSWKQHLEQNEPYDHNCQYIFQYKDSTYISTLEDGLIIKSTNGWENVLPPTISSNAPRQMTEFNDNLYLRHGNGKVDVFDGKTWTKDVLSTTLPRKQASSISSDDKILYVTQWGGWSEYDGTSWSHHLKEPKLQGVQITVIYPDGDGLWLGTQGKGLARVDRNTDAITWHDERTGLSDDWIRCLKRSGDLLYAGTFVGGLSCWNGKSWSAIKELAGMEITDLAVGQKNAVIASTRRGVYRIIDDNGAIKCERVIDTDAFEAQALNLQENRLSIGTRNGFYTKIIATSP